MPQGTHSYLDEDVLNRLKARASDHRRSLQAELKVIIEESAASTRKLSR